VNADEQLNTDHLIGNNLFAYCYNNPVNLGDYDGKEPVTLTLVLFATVCTFLLATTMHSYALMTGMASPTFQNAWNSMCASASNALSTALRSLIGAQCRASVWLTSKAKEIQRVLQGKFEKIKTPPKYRKATEVHHIVAKKASNAQHARDILRAVGITDINSPLNLVEIKTGLHRRLHTDQYYGWANSVVISAYNSAQGNAMMQRVNVVKALDILRNWIESMDAAAPF
jgi:hypothetical protein